MVRLEKRRLKGKDEEKPREKLTLSGPEALTDGELLALLFETGSSQEDVYALSERYLREKGGLRGIFTMEEDLESYGVKTARICKLKAVREIFRRLPFTLPDRVDTSEKAFQLTRPYFLGLGYEMVVVLYLSEDYLLLRKDVFDFCEAKRCYVPVKRIVRNAVQASSSFVILIHNHPSGCLLPSAADLKVVTGLDKTFRPLQILLLDSLIVFENEYISFRDKQIGPFLPKEVKKL